jgi:hypothetical protein
MMLIINTVKLADSNEQKTQHNETVFTKSRAITLQILDTSISETRGAQLHMLLNISVKFHDPRSNTISYSDKTE